MAADVLNYTGNAGLAAGSGADSGIANIGVGDMTVGLGALQNLAKRKNDVADTEYRQKIADRDKVFGMVANLEADWDKVLPEDRDAMREKIGGIEDQLLKNPNILADKNAYAEVQKATSDFNELNAYKKANYKTVQEDLATASKITDPRARQAYLDHIQEQRTKLAKNPYELYDPKKPETVWNYDDFMKAGGNDTSVTRMKNGLYKKVDTFTKVSDLLDHYRTSVIDGMNKTVKDQWDAWDKDFMDHIGTEKPETSKATFDKWNERIQQANSRLPEGQKIKGIQYDKDGKPVVDNIDDFNIAAYVGTRYSEKLGVEEFDDDAKTKSEIADKYADVNLKNAQAKKALLDGKGGYVKDLSEAEWNKQRAKSEKENREAFDTFGIKETEGAFRRVYDSANHHGKDAFDLNKKLVSVQDRIGLGIKPDDNVKSIVYDKKAGVYRIVKETTTPSGAEGVAGTTATVQENVTPLDYYRNNLKEFYSKKMTDENGKVDPALLEFKISQALNKGLEKAGYKSAEQLNYITGGLKDDNVYPITSKSGKQYYQQGDTFYQITPGGKKRVITEDEIK